MPDYMYLLESRLSPEQRAALERVQELSRSMEINVYLTGGAIRDLISGQPIRDLDFTVEGNPVRIVRELEKGGAKVLWESEKLRHYEMIFAGDADGSISAARDDVYDHPGAKPEYRFSGIMEDLRRRDFSFNAIAISLNAQSRGLLLDPTNGLADLERQEIRALSIHAFTNQPVRLMRILRYCARMGSKMESRTQEWFELAMERKLYENIEGAEAGHEVRALAREDNPAATLKQWEARGLLAAIHPRLQKRRPDYDSLNKLARVRTNFLAAGIRPRMQVAVTSYVIGRLKVARGCSGLAQYGVSVSRNGCDRASGSRGAEGRQDSEGPEDQLGPRRLFLPCFPAARDACVYRGRASEPQGGFQNSQLHSEMAALAAWSPHGRTGRAGRGARAEVRQDHRADLRNAASRQGAHAGGPHEGAAQSGRHQGRAEEKGREGKEKTQGQRTRRGRKTI